MKINFPIPDGEVLRLVKVGFDSLENRSPRYETTLGVFVRRGGLTVREEAEAWLTAQPEPQTYEGWDNHIYPQFRVESESVLN